MGQKFANLNLAALSHIDGGKVNLAFQRAIEDCLRDIVDRPRDKTARTITMTMQVLPVLGEDPADENRMIATGATGTVKVKTSIPDRVSKAYSFGLTETKDAQGNPKPSAFFSIDSPDNIDQLVLPGVGADEDDE